MPLVSSGATDCLERLVSEMTYCVLNGTFCSILVLYRNGLAWSFTCRVFNTFVDILTPLVPVTSERHCTVFDNMSYVSCDQ